MRGLGAEAVLGLVLPVFLGSVAPARAQGPDFLFGAPKGSVTMRGGWLFASTGSDVYSFFSDLLTIESSDFDGPTFGGDVAFALHPRFDLVVGLDFSRSGVSSEYRDFVESNDLPIVQETELTTVPITAGLKLYVGPRGRDISRYAYVPAAFRPYVGGGGGFLYYRLEQVGDFVDFVDFSIFSAQLQSDGWGLAAHAFAGVDVRLTPKWYLTVEGRYLWADADLESDFVGFDPIDLSGFRTNVGFSYTF